MTLFETIRLIVLSIPFGMFVMYLFFIGITCTLKATPINAVVKRLLTILACYSIMVCISGLMLPFYYYQYSLFTRYSILYCASASYTVVIFYHFFCFATQPGKKFSLTHYLWPAMSCVALLVVNIFFPDFWMQAGNRLSLWTALIFCVYYNLLSLYKIYRFQLTLSAASGDTGAVNNERALPFILLTLLYPLVLLVFQLAFGPEPGIAASLLIMACIVLALMMNIPLGYAIISHYAENSMTGVLLFVSAGISISEEPKASGPVETVSSQSQTNIPYPAQASHNRKNKKLDRRIFEQYFRKEKPYLDPHLTIYDLVEPLQSNRTYISKFVNSTYDMNFTSYINLCRLKEMKRLQSLPDNRKNKKSITELALQAGFGNYDSYYRAKCQLTDKINKL